MANGTTRNALSQMALKGKGGASEMQEEMDILAQGKGTKIELKASASEHNHSSESLHNTRK